jgi:hypothetical protein
MIRRIVCVALVLCGGGAILATAAVHGGDEKKSSSRAPFVHVVIVRLKADAPADAADALIADAHEMLAKIPTVREVRAGKPAPQTGFAKTDYHVGLLVRFDDLDGLQTYEKHQLHRDYIEKHGKNVELDKLAVFDFVEQKK